MRCGRAGHSKVFVGEGLPEHAILYLHEDVRVIKPNPPQVAGGLFEVEEHAAYIS